MTIGNSYQEHHTTCNVQVRLGFKQKKNAKSVPRRLLVQTEKKVSLGYVE